MQGLCASNFLQAPEHAVRRCNIESEIFPVKSQIARGSGTNPSMINVSVACDRYKNVINADTRLLFPGPASRSGYCCHLFPVILSRGWLRTATCTPGNRLVPLTHYSAVPMTMWQGFLPSSLRTESVRHSPIFGQ